MNTPQNRKRRGWVAFGAGAFLVAFMAAIWIWVDRLLALNGLPDAAAAAFSGRLNIAFALIVIAGLLGGTNGWLMGRSGRSNTILVVGLLIAFVVALIIAWSATTISQST